MTRNEKNLAICREPDCRKIVTRISTHRHPNGDPRYVDETGSPWNGRTCPSCFKAKRRARYKRKGES